MASTGNKSLLSLSTKKLEENASRIAQEKKYWKLKIIFSALEAVACCETPNPRIPPDVLEYLRMIVNTSELKTLKKKSQDDDFDETKFQEQLLLLKEKKPKISHETKVVIETLVSREIRNLAEGFVKVHVEKLKESPLEEDKEELKALSESDFPLGQVLQMLVEKKKQEELLDEKIECLDKDLKKEYPLLQEEIREVNGLMNELALLNKAKEEEEKKFMKNLSTENENLMSEAGRLEEARLVVSHPTSLISDITETKKKLITAAQDLQEETKRLNDIIRMYEDLGPDFEELLEQYEKIEGEIQSKEWVLKNLKDFPNVTLNDSL